MITGVGDTTDGGGVSPGVLGFAVMFALAAATVLLIRSMVGHLRKVRYGPDPRPGGDADGGVEPQDPPPPQDSP